MKNIKYLTLLLLFANPIFWGCVAHIPIGTSTNLSNQKKAIESGRFERKWSNTAIGITIGTTLVGGYLGYRTDLINQYDEKGQKKGLTGANVALGTAVGFGVSYALTTLIKGDKSIEEIRNKKELDYWIKMQYDNRYKLVNIQKDFNSFTIIENSAFQNYIFSKEDDIKEYIGLFGYSNPDFSRAMERSIGNFDFNKSINIYNNYNSYLDITIKGKLEQNLIDNAHRFTQVIDLINRIATLKNRCKDKAYNLISDQDDALKFSTAYPEFRVQAAGKALNYCNSTYSYINHSKNFPELKEQSRAKAFENCKNQSDCYSFLETFPEWREQIRQKIFDDCTSISDYSTFKAKFSEWQDKAKEKALSICKSISDYRILATNFSELKEQASQLAFQLCTNLDNCISYKSNFPYAFTNEISSMALKNASNMDDCYRVYNEFSSIELEAANKAFSLCNSISTYANFAEKFSRYSSDAKKAARAYLTNLSNLRLYLRAFENKALYEVNDASILNIALTFSVDEQRQLSKELEKSTMRFHTSSSSYKACSNATYKIMSLKSQEYNKDLRFWDDWTSEKYVHNEDYTIRFLPNGIMVKTGSSSFNAASFSFRESQDGWNRYSGMLKEDGKWVGSVSLWIYNSTYLDLTNGSVCDSYVQLEIDNVTIFNIFNMDRILNGNDQFRLWFKLKNY